MKSAVLKNRINRFNNYAPYPNAATGRQVMQKVLDLLIMAASGMGISAILLFILVLF